MTKEEEDKNHDNDNNKHDVSQTTTTGAREQSKREEQPVVRIAATIAVPALAALAIVFILAAGSNTEQAFAPPPPPCPECGTVINGTGEGTITIPESKKAEIRPPPCDACDAQISFEAFEDAKGTGGTITITYVDEEEGITQTIQDDDVSNLKVSSEDKFVLRGTAEIGPPSCAECTTVNYVLVGEVTDKETGEATMVFKADGGIKGNFVSDDVTISIIGPA
jgi:hypothetical protein